jgi:hypothetical protein
MEKAVLVCTTVARFKDPVKGSIAGQCLHCHTPIWISPSTLPILAQVTALCPACALKRVQLAEQQGETMKFGGFIPGQLKELGLEEDGNDR